jgi:chemotaxis protein MotA
LDLATIVGIVLGFGLIVLSILLDGDLMSFVNIPSVMIVVGGTLAATLIHQKMTHVIGAIGVAMNAFFDRLPPPEQLVETIHELAMTARKEGVLGLEHVEVKDRLLARGVVMAIDGMDKEFIAATMQRELAATRARHARGQAIFRFMAATAPAMGMIGTLIGLVNMLKNMSDPAAIGPAMAVALLTTFYGAVLAFLVFGPIADKLEARTKQEMLHGNLAISGIESVANGDNKTLTQTKLDALLSPRERERLAAATTGSAT